MPQTTIYLIEREAKSMENQKPQEKQGGINLQLLGFKSPMEVIDLLALIKVDGDPVVKDDKSFLDPRLKAKEVMEYFHKHFGVIPDKLPFIAYVIKNKIKKGAHN
jgi:hypothetical protein